MLQKTATVLLVSDEVFKFEDSKVRYIAEQLHALNYNVEKAAVILHKDSVLAAEIETSIKQSDIVILIGGLEGPYSQTVCRVVSKAFHQKLIFNEKLTRLLHVQNGSLEMVDANIPMHAKILEHSSSNNSNHGHICPAVYIQGLVLTMGDPELLKLSFTNILVPFLKNLNRKPKLKRTLIVQCGQNINFMQKIPRKDNVDVSCEMVENDVKVTLTSTSMSSLLGYEECFKEAYGDNILRSGEGTDIAKLVYKQLDYSHIRSSIECIEDCFTKYGPENVFISFNGGKDCTVLLHLTLAVLRKNYPNYTNKTFCVYIENPHPFSELNNFIAQCEWYYDLNILKLSKNIKESLALVLKNKPHMKACLMGTRRTDPFSENLQSFQMTDSDWPQLMRVSPLLDWHYSEIWDYLLNLKVPYCCLYDMGYTSLGSRLNSIQNPALVVYDSLKDSKTYLPAYKLLNASYERNGRKLT